MKKEKTLDENSYVLPKYVDNKLYLEPEKLYKLTKDEIKHYAHELCLNQIELETQNKELRNSKINLERLTAQYTDLYDNAPVGYITLNKDGIIQNINHRTAKMLLTDKKAIIGKSLFDYVLEEDKDKLSKHIGHIYKYKISRMCDIKLKKSNDTMFYAQLESIVVQNRKTNLIQCRTVIQDITLRKKTEEEINKIKKFEFLGTFAGSIANDFNNLLTGIFCNIEMIKEYGAPNEKGKEYIELALEAFDKAKLLTKQLLTFAKGGDLKIKVINIEKVLKESAFFCLSGTDICCEYFIDNNIWEAIADEGQVDQVFNNILINARQSLPKSGKIKIKRNNICITQKQDLPLSKGNYLKISITDHGVGISEKNLSKIFDPFFTTKKYSAGLGLTTAYSILKKNHGYISVESELDKGTTFHVYLPAQIVNETIKWPRSREIINGKGSILLMDDEDIIRKSTQYMLQNLGYKADVCENGEDAILLYKNAIETGEYYNVVILDLTVFKGMGGKETLKELKKINPDVKAVVSSGYSDDPILKNYKKYNVTGAIPKIYNIKEHSKI